MKIFSNHKQLFGIAFLFFIVLSVAVAIFPALDNQKNNAQLPGSEPASEMAIAGKYVFIANGCVACHTQQVRNVAMDKPWGSRPGVPADYAANKRMAWWMNTATLMGTERTGPDLTNISNRLPSADWHLLHLFNPRAVVAQSIMPSYPWMFAWKDRVESGEKEVKVPIEFSDGHDGQTLVAKEEALQLVAYLQSLKQTPLPTGAPDPFFLYEMKAGDGTSKAKSSVGLDGALLYATHCQACHQPNGEGLMGAFPPLKGSKIVLDENPEVLIDIIMNGYNAREEFAEMPAVGSNSGLTPEEVTAIANHERSSWGNDAVLLGEDEVKAILELINNETIN